MATSSAAAGISAAVHQVVAVDVDHAQGEGIVEHRPHCGVAVRRGRARSPSAVKCSASRRTTAR